MIEYRACCLLLRNASQRTVPRKTYPQRAHCSLDHQAIPRKMDIIGGDGPRMLDLQEMVERERLEERVEFLFSVPHAQVRDVLVRGDVFLNCSLTESFCIAILEAASCGLLVVSTNVGGVPEVLPQDLIVLSEPNVPSMVDSLLCAIARQLESPLDAWKTHERVKQMYSWHRVAVETVQVYDRIAQLERKTFLERLAIYYSLGGLSGIAVCYCVLLTEMVYQFVEWRFPRSTIDRVPDLCADGAVWEPSHEEEN